MFSPKKIKVKETLSASRATKEADREEKIFEADGQLAVDVFEDGSNFTVVTAVAGVPAKDIEILIDKDMLIIKGKRYEQKKEEKRNYFYQECHWGSFSRKIILPENIDISKAQAEFNQGILTIKFPFNKSGGKKNISLKEG